MTMEIVGNDAQLNGKVTLLKNLEIYGDIKNKTKDTSFDFSENLSFKIKGDEKLNIGNDNTIFKSKGIIWSRGFNCIFCFLFCYWLSIKIFISICSE